MNALINKCLAATFIGLPLLGGCAHTPNIPARAESPAVSEIIVPPATPAGVTIQYTGLIPKNRTFSAVVIRQGSGQMVFADAAGMTLYTYDKDAVPNKSTCLDTCVARRPVFQAPAAAKPIGDWTIVTRDDGIRQWAYKGKPLHKFIDDTEIGATSGAATQPAGNAAPAAGASVPKDSPKEPEPWSLARYIPGADSAVPAGFSVVSVWDAPGEALTDFRGKTIYWYVGKDRALCAQPPCTRSWVPVQASQLARTSGDFTLINRADGIRQWAYKGRPLYTFEKDLAPGDANGVGVDPKFSVAMMKSYWMPSMVKLQSSPENGKVLADSQGMTLYRRTIYRFQVSGFSLPRGIDVVPAIGRAAGTKGCDATCQKTWQPFIAPDDAISTGFWQVLTRDDGRKQWAYKGYALYSNANDKKPGNTIGSLTFELFLNNGIQVASSEAEELANLVQSDNQTGLLWVHMYP